MHRRHRPKAITLLRRHRLPEPRVGRESEIRAMTDEASSVAPSPVLRETPVDPTQSGCRLMPAGGQRFRPPNSLPTMRSPRGHGFSWPAAQSRAASSNLISSSAPHVLGNEWSVPRRANLLCFAAAGVRGGEGTCIRRWPFGPLWPSLNGIRTASITRICSNGFS